MNELLRQLDLQWYSHRNAKLGALRLDRVWGLAVFERNKRLRNKVSDFELFGLVYETLAYCIDRFDPSHLPKCGLSGRRTVEDRFINFFKWKLVRKLGGYVRKLRGDNDRPGDRRYRGPGGAAQDSVPPAALWHLVHRAIDRLNEREQAVITLRYWEGAGYGEIATQCGYSSRFKAKREHDRVIAKLQGIVDWEIANDACVSHSAA